MHSQEKMELIPAEKALEASEQFETRYAEEALQLIAKFIGQLAVEGKTICAFGFHKHVNVNWSFIEEESRKKLILEKVKKPLIELGYQLSWREPNVLLISWNDFEKIKR